jgi:hypothetical protein
MEYRIDRDALGEFISRQVAQIEAAPIPKLLADVVELRLRHEAVRCQEVAALWLGAGLATHKEERWSTGSTWTRWRTSSAVRSN